VESTISAFMMGLAGELARIDQRGDALINESDPRTIAETLNDWERMLALPDPCVSFDQSTAQRVGGVVAKYIARGGQSPAYFIEVAAALGFTITITEFTPFRVNDTCDKPCYGDDWAYTWLVTAPTQSVEYFTVADSVNDPLAWWGNQILECVLSRLKPAHTIVQFAYA
jgi:uncharacterized protein YmfQ (DUF2313 family)